MSSSDIWKAAQEGITKIMWSPDAWRHKEFRAALESYLGQLRNESQWSESDILKVEKTIVFVIDPPSKAISTEPSLN